MNLPQLVAINGHVRVRGQEGILPEFSGIATASSVAKFWKVYRAKGQ